MTDMTPEQAIRSLETAILPDPHDERDINGPWLEKKIRDVLPILRAALSRPAVPADLKEVFSRIEDEIARGELTAAQVFTRMRTAVQSHATPAPAVPEGFTLSVRSAKAADEEKRGVYVYRKCADKTRGTIVWEEANPVVFALLRRLAAAPAEESSGDAGSALTRNELNRILGWYFDLESHHAEFESLTAGDAKLADKLKTLVAAIPESAEGDSE